MIFWIIAFLWWFIGFGFMLFLTRADELTWGILFECIVLGFVGPGFMAIFGLSLLINAEFWSKPVFGKKNETKNSNH